MCILFIAVNQHKDYPLIVAANRDEFYARPTAPSEFWSDNPNILAGRDIQAGGTWMGINRQGAFAGLTNIRAPHTFRAEAKSRGELVSQFLTAPPDNQTYLQQIRNSASYYNGYNLIFGRWNNLMVYNNHLDQVDQLETGFYGLSNAWLNSDWPKIETGVDGLKKVCQNMEKFDKDSLFSLLGNQIKAEDHLLPETGVAPELEKELSSIFIHLPNYGTRSSTLMYVDQNHHVHWHERSFDTGAKISQESQFSFPIEN
ncbi:NRDE family protein [Paraneptunicella aestuarii]|uniref:NRDE family protein n=1 Tax=Paraneptunicella aestuarii TaxID=2831148 RepID=UPI001E641ECA|nr:NRDE family protein [Paraneptunicella aestuarii]UAA40503.1 NRDE family protein [Paraneptunicella aestuarii]